MYLKSKTRNIKLICAFFLCACFTIDSLQAQFKNVTRTAGLVHGHVDAQFIGGGAAFFDFDQDGWEDLFFTGGVIEDKLYINDTKGGFEDHSTLLPENTNKLSRTSGVIAADFDNDGCTDLLVTTFDQESACYLLKNTCNGTFEDISLVANIVEKGPSIGATVLDFDLDGDLDIYVINYIDSIQTTRDSIGIINGFAHDCSLNYFYQNNGDGTFTEVAEEMGVAGLGCSLAVMGLSIKNQPAIYVANDFGAWIQPNELFVYEPDSNKFVERASEIGLDAAIYGMGIAMGDVGNDGDFDFYISNLGRNVFYENRGDTFLDVATEFEVENTKARGELLATSWGTFFFDFDSDADLDLFVANGFIPSAHFLPTSLQDVCKLYIWRNGTFMDQSELLGVDYEFVNRGAIYGDYDHDGDLDLVLATLSRKGSVNLNLNFQLFRNDTPTPFNHAIVSLEGTTNNRDGVGTTVKLFLPDKTLMRYSYVGGTHASSNSKFLHFGLGRDTSIDSLQISWANGGRDTYYDLSANEKFHFVEGRATYEIVGCTDTNAKNYNQRATLNEACVRGTVSVGDIALTSSLEIYPTLTTGQLFIKASKKIGDCRVNIYDELGRIVKTQQLTINKNELNLLTLEGEQTGIYFIQIQSELGNITEKIVVY